MGLLSNKIRREQLNPGDHIYTWRNGYSYSHHGIFEGDGKVIHLTRAEGLIIFSSSPSHPSGDDRVVRCSIEEFLSGGDLYLYEYGVKRALFLIKRGGTCTRTPSDPPKDVLGRASILLQKGFGNYNLFHTNCEDFAMYCKTGLLTKDKSKPGRSGQINFVYSIFLAVSLAPYPFLPSGLTSLALVVCSLLYCVFRLLDDRDSVEKVAVDKLDLSDRPTARTETDSTRSNSSSLSASYYFAFIICVLNYWSWTPTSRILLWIKIVILSAFFRTFVSDHLRNRPVNVIHSEYVACIIWLGYWYWSSESRIYFWTKLCDLESVLLLFVSDDLRWKLQGYSSQTTIVLGLWYWTPESTVLLWIRSLLLIQYLFVFIPDHFRNPRSKFSKFFAGCVAAFLLGLDYRDYIFRNITKGIFM